MLAYGKYVGAHFAAMSGGNALPDRREQRSRLARLDADPATLEALCERLARGVSPVDVAHDYGVGLHRFRKWLMEPGYPERLKEYQFALECHADVVAREIIPIADEDGPFVQRDRLRVEARLKVLPFWDARYREPKSGVNISVGACGSLIAILAGMDSHGQEPTAERIVYESPRPDGIQALSECEIESAGLNPVGDALLAAPQDEMPSTSESALPLQDQPAVAATLDEQDYADEERL